MSACPTLTNLISLLADFTQVSADAITIESTLADIGMDSLDQVEILNEIEEHFEIEFPESDELELTTVAALYQAILKTQTGAPQHCPYCHQPPNILGVDDQHFAECSNQLDCPGWPYTDPYPTQELAIAAWNTITRQES